MLTVTPISFSARKSMISSVSRVALVVRLKPMPRPCAAACARAYSTTWRSSLKFISVSPPKNVMCTAWRPADWASRKSTDAVAVSTVMYLGLPSGVAILSAPNS